MSKKILAMLMAVAMAFSLLPVTALAGNPSLLSITPPNDGKFATYEFYISETAESPWYTQTVKTGDTLNPPADPTLAGFHFTGWKTADGAEVPFGTVTVTETSIIKCFAQWAENKNPIHVYFMAAEKAAENSNEVVYTGVAQNGAVAIPEDYKDITWKTADGGTFNGTGVTGDMNVYPASASCWLTFDSQGGSAIASHYVRQGESFELSKVGKPTKAGYTFAGWSLEANGTKQTEVIPNGDTKLYALWTPTTADYTVIHWQENANDDGYSFKESQKLSGKTDGQTNATAKSYKGFTATEIEQQTISGDGSTIVNVYYQRNSYTIHFYYREYVSWKEYTDIQITAKHGADISKQWPEIKGSKTWSTTKKLSDGPFQANIQTMPLGGAKYYGPKTGKTFESAQYYVEVLPGEDGTVTQGDVTYKLHHTDTTPGSKLKVTEEDKYPLTGFTYEEGTENGNRYNNAKFYYTRNSYDVVYISNGAEKKDSYKYEQDISGAGNYTPDNAPAGYEFGGWYSDPIGTKKYNFSGKKMPAQNITVYAKWVPITLTLTIQDVDGVGSGDVSYKQAINKAGVYTDATAKLAAENKTVLYWVNCETNQKEDVNRQMTTNLTIRPVLKGDTYTVTYTSGANDSQKYWYNTIAKVKNYTGDNAGKFLYWTDTANNNKKYHPGDEIQMTANVTLKPKFSGENPGQTKYSVIYHSNFEPDQTCTADSVENYTTFFTKTYEETRLPSQNGYEFTGWNTQSDGGGTSFAAGGPALMNGANDNDLYAQWSQSTYTLTYNANGGKFGLEDSAPTTKQESDIRAGDHSLNYSPEYIPTHAQSGDKNVVFIGWSTRDNDKKIYDKGENIPTLIKSIQMDGNKTVYAVWGYDAIGKDNKPDGVPDVFNAVVTYNIVGGTWDGTNNSATEVIKVKTFDETTKVWTNTDAKLSSIPNINEVRPDENHTLSGSWGDPDSTPTENTVVTADKMYTYTLSEVTTGTLTITKKVEGDGLTVDSLPEDFQITVKDAQGETKGTLTKTDEAKKADDTLTWTISELAPGTYTVSEENAGVDGYTCTETYSSSVATDTEKSVTVTENGSSMTVTNKYTKEAEPPTPPAPVKWDVSRSKTATPLTKNSNGDWTTTVTLKLPTVSKTEANSTETEVPPDPITAISEGSKVEDTIGKKFTLVGIGDSALENGSFTMTVGGKEITGVVINGHTVNFGEPNSDGSYPYTVDYALTNNTFTWNINEDVDADTEVTLSYKLKLTTPKTAAGTHGVEDLNGDGIVDGTESTTNTTVVAADALYTNESATMVPKDSDGNTGAELTFPKPSVSYKISSGNSGSHSGGSRPSLNTKDHYGYIIGYPVDYYTGQPTTDQTKKPVRPEGKITRAEVATIYFRMLTDESRTKFWSQSSGYSDVKTGDWFNNAVSTLSNAGIIAGYEDGSFRPNGYITRAEFATIAARFFDVTYNGKDLFPDISGHWAKDYINQAANKGFVNGYEDGTFKPDRNITRAEAVTLVNRTLDRHPDKNHFTKDMLVWPDNMDQTKWYYADMQEATNSHTYQMKENSDKTKYENWTKTLPIRNWEALEKAWSNANSSQGNGNVV